MNLDELMAVWRSQDAAPLHDVNKTLLHLALRQDEAKLQKAAAQRKMDHLPRERRFGRRHGGFPRHDDLHPTTAT